MRTISRETSDDDVVISVAISRETYERLKQISARCAEISGTPEKDGDIADLIEQALSYALARIDPAYS